MLRHPPSSPRTNQLFPYTSLCRAATLHGGRRQVLVIDALTPMPDRDSGSLRLVNLMRLLRDEGAHVVFLLSDLKHAGAYTQALQALGIEDRKSTRLNSSH